MITEKDFGGLLIHMKYGDSFEIGDKYIDGKLNPNYVYVTHLGQTGMNKEDSKIRVHALKDIPILREKAGVRTPKKKANPYPEGTPEWHNFEQRNTLTLNKGNC